jgi:formylglycine-generating enzyme required for sulfatase activity
VGSPEGEEDGWEHEGPQHLVRIEPGFWMWDTPCTQALWQAVMGNNPSRFPGELRPVERVSWDECQEFVERINTFLRRPDESAFGPVLALPSEAQWEYACRSTAKHDARYSNDLDAIAWYRDNSGGETHPVGEKLPNAWGLYDMLGNVWEWCADAWDNTIVRSRIHTPGGTVPIAWSSNAAGRVIRGGSWNGGARDVRASDRRRVGPSSRNADLGFRCAEFRAGRELSER